MQRGGQASGSGPQFTMLDNDDFFAMLDPALRRSILTEQPTEILKALNPKHAAEVRNTSTYFHIHEHSIPGQHLRGYPGGIRTRQEDVLYLAVKQYIPIDRVEPIPENAITIIGLHGNGFVKELYEPFMEELCKRLKERDLHVRGIWMADNSNQGASGVLNERTHGPTIDFFDHSRDLLLMINHFRDEMPRPLIGFAHSYGCPQLIQLSLMHPRLLSTLILCEPIIFDPVGLDLPNHGRASSKRRDLWPTRAEAEQQLGGSFKNQQWDDRVIELFFKHGLRPVPTLLYDPAQDPNVPKAAVTLTTTKHHEVWSYNMTNFDEEDEKRDRILKPYQSAAELKELVVRPELRIILNNLPLVRPSVFYVYGGKSRSSPPPWRKQNYELTGTGHGGSGGAKVGKVKEFVFENSGHLLPCESGVLEQLAEVSADWTKHWFQEWLEEEKIVNEYANPEADESGIKLSELSHASMKMTTASPRPLKLPNKM